MSNPITGVWALNGNLTGTPSALTGVEPIRYSSGLWLEQAATNEHYDPRHRHSDSWLASGGTVTYTGSPDYYHEISSATNDTGGRTSQVYTTNPMPGIAGAWVFSCDIEYVSGGTDWKISAFEFNTGGSVVVSNAAVKNITVLAGTNRYFGTYTPTDGTTTRVSFALRRRSSTAGAIRVRNTDIVSGSYLASAINGSAGSGYSWGGITDNSTSTRAASSASVPTAGILDPATGSLAFRLTRKIDTGDIEYILNCGTDGDDRLRIYIDTDDRLRVAWDTGGALPQSVVSSSTIAVGTEYLVYTEWDGINIAMSLDAGTLVTGIRDVPLGSWGTDDLVLGP